MSQLKTSGWVGLVIVVGYIGLALTAPVLAPYPYTEFHLEDTLESPSFTYWFGTDQFGRDIFSRVLMGSRNILVLATVATSLGLILGVTVGLTAGYSGGLLSGVLMRVMDIIMSFPSLLLALLILSTLGPGQGKVTIAIALTFMPKIARVVRSKVLEIKTREYVDAAQIAGATGLRIVVQVILPNAVDPIIVEASLRFAYAILIASSLGFLGLGLQPPSPDWGLQISEGRNFLLVSPWVVIFPSMAIASLVVGVNLVADSLGWRLTRR